MAHARIRSAERRRNVEGDLDSPSYVLAEQDMALLAGASCGRCACNWNC